MDTSKTVLIISASARRNSNSDALADSFMEGAKAAGHNVEKVSLADKKIGFCKGCFLASNLVNVSSQTTRRRSPKRSVTQTLLCGLRLSTIMK